MAQARLFSASQCLAHVCVARSWLATYRRIAAGQKNAPVFRAEVQSEQQPIGFIEYYSSFLENNWFVYVKTTVSVIQEAQFTSAVSRVMGAFVPRLLAIGKANLSFVQIGAHPGLI